MRWKLVIAASLLAAAAVAGALCAAWYFLLTPSGGREAPVWAAALSLLAPLGAITFAAVFVYRHTARRRTLQAAATALVSIALTLGALLALPRLFVPRPTPPTDVAPTKNVGQLKLKD